MEGASSGTVDSTRAESWRIDRREGEVIEVSVEQRGVDLRLKLRRPQEDGTRHEENFAHGTSGTESMIWIAPASGRYDLEIEGAGLGGHGAYGLTVAPARLPTERDRAVAKAQSATDRGRRAGEAAGDRLPEALESFTEARAGWRALGERGRELQAMFGMAHAMDLLGDAAGSLAVSRESLALAREEHDLWGQASAAFGLAHDLDLGGDGDAAIALYRESIALARMAGDANLEGKSLGNLCMLASDRDEPQHAMELCDEALAVFATVGDDAPYARLAVGAIHQELGDRDAALEQYTRAHEVFVARNLRWGIATANEFIARVHLEDGDAARALAVFETALAEMRAIGDRLGQARALSGAGQALQELGRHAEAEPRHREALALGEAHQSAFARAIPLTAIGRCRAAEHDLEGAAARFKEAIALAQEAKAPSAEAAARAELARVRRAAGDSAEALEELDRALALLEQIRDRISAPELRESFATPSRSFYDLRIELLMEKGDREGAFLALERSRARSLLETLAGAGADPEGGAPAEVAAELAAARAALASAESRQTRTLAERRSAAEIDAAGSAVRGALLAVQSARAKARSRSPEYAALLRPPDITSAGVRAALPADVVLLEYWLGDSGGWLWAISRERVDAWPLPARAEIDTLASAFHSSLVARNESPPGENAEARRARIAAADARFPLASKALSDVVLAPAKERLAPRIWIAGDGLLQYIPFAALEDPAAPGKLLVEEREVASVPSAAVLVALRTSPRAPAPPRIAILADPVFSADDPRLGGAASPASGATTRGLAPGMAGAIRPFDRLRFTRDEAQAIRALAGTSGLLALDFDASRETITGGALHDYGIVHMAVHGVVDARQPELSGLVLSLVDRGGKPRNGMLRLHEIYQLDLEAELVVLSACQTALGKDVRGEGMVGLTRGFLHAGAARVVASLWQVHDRGTAELMRRFYEGVLRDKKPAAAALRDAQRSMLADPNWRAPYYWSAFIVQGDPGAGQSTTRKR